MNEIFDAILKLATQLRPGYADSLSERDPAPTSKIAEFWPEVLPKLISTIYSTVSGTRAAIKDQALMDFIPGYRLIHIDELALAYNSLRSMVESNEYFPVLANYSNDYICVAKNGKVFGFSHEDAQLYLMHVSGEQFLKTICEFYKHGVYFIDKDGYLDYDPEQEQIYGAELNPEIPYWTE